METIQFTLTTRQLEKLVKEANLNEDQEDMVTFHMKNGRLIVTQKDCGHNHITTLMNKPC